MRSAASPWILENVRRDRVRGGHELDPGLVVVAAHVLGIGRVEHEQHGLGQAGAQPAHRLDRHVGAGRVVGVGEEHDAGARRDAAQDRVDVGGQVRLGRNHGRGAVRQDGDAVDEEAMGGEDALVARPEVGVRDEAQELVEPAPQTMRSGSRP